MNAEVAGPDVSPAKAFRDVGPDAPETPGKVTNRFMSETSAV